MKKNGFLLIAIIFGVLFQSCGQEFLKASGNVETKEYEFSDFTGLDVANDFKVYVTFSDTEEKVSIEADDNLQEHIVVEKNGNTLEIRLKNNVSIRGQETLNAYISTSLINDFEGAGDVEIYLQNELKTNNLDVELSGDSKFDGLLEVEDMNVELRGDSEMKLVGTTDRLEAKLKGDSKIERYGFVVKVLEIDLAGDSEGFLTVTESIDVKASGDSNLYYKGEAVIVRQKLTGDSELIKKD